mgnify:CR=1 FL=1|tara:strand:- start:191 stop:382 length:192 start_codon:yes stop_codon:yes gene_type:complete
MKLLLENWREYVSKKIINFFLKKPSCRAKVVYDKAIYFCVKKSGHFGKHKTYRGTVFCYLGEV